jgi:hypothetical protein
MKTNRTADPVKSGLIILAISVSVAVLPSASPTPAIPSASGVANSTKSGLAKVTSDPAANVTVTVRPNGSVRSPYSPLLLLRGGTRRLYANVCLGSNALDCARPADITVTWQATCGVLSQKTGPYVDYTAPNSGPVCTITATNVASGATGIATATLANPTVSVDVIPAAITLYKNQYALLQAVVTGSVNRSVRWSLTTDPGNAGKLTSEGWTATFSASAPGTYSATATSGADGTKAAVITLYVTANVVPATATANHTEPVDCTAVGGGTTYEVGPTRAFTKINSVPWNRLVAGDTVRIHNDGTNGSPTTYDEKWLIKQSGTASQPIRVCGVPNASGELPVISGSGATTSADYDYGIIEDRAPIVIYNHAGAYGNNPTYPKYITIEGLEIINEQSALNFAPRTGGQQNWGAFGGAIWMQHGSHVTLRGLDLERDQQGLFVNSQSPESQMSRWLLFQGNYVANNGIMGGQGSHQIYAQAFGLVIQGNYFDEPLKGMQGAQIKERCVMCFTRYNYISSVVAGLRLFDIVEPQGASCLVMTQQYYSQGGQSCGNSVDAVAAAEDWYGTDYVYGNIVKFAQPAQPVHYSGDECSEFYRGGTLYFYNNTLWESGDVYWRWISLDTGPPQAACSATTPVGSNYAGGRFTNNVIKLSAGSTNPYFFWVNYYSTFLQLDANWISDSWGSGIGAGADGDGTGWSKSGVSLYQTGNDAPHITGITNLVTGTGLPFDRRTYAPTSGSPLIGAAVPLPAAVSSALPVTMQYNPSTYLMSPRARANDLGAVAF